MVFDNNIKLIYTLFAYLVGSIPSGVILSKVFKKKDIRNYGSRNIGATNALRVGGKLLGILTLISDLFKSFLVVLIASIKLQTFEIFYGFICIIGHIFPIWLKFKGGKGVASMFGIILGISPLYTLLLACIWINLFLLWKIVSIASLISLCLVITAIIIMHFSASYFIFFTFIMMLVIYKHKNNIFRLCKGNESTLSF